MRISNLYLELCTDIRKTFVKDEITPRCSRFNYTNGYMFLTDFTVRCERNHRTDSR